jgi:PAS domain S-box-containing protein
MNKRLGLVPKITLTFVFFAALLLCMMGFLVLATGREALETAIAADVASVAAEKESAFDRWVDGALSDIVILAGSAYIQENTEFLLAPEDSARKQQAQVALAAELHSSTAPTAPFLDILILHPETGQVLVATNPDEIGQVRADRSYFVDGRSGPYVQHPFYSATLQETGMAAAAPIHNEDGTLIGVLVGRLNLTAIMDIINVRTESYESQEAFLIGASDQSVTIPQLLLDETGQPARINSEGIERCLAGDSGTLLADDYRGEPVVAAFRWMEAHQGCLIVKVDQAEVFAEIEDGFGGSLLIISIALLMVSIGLAYGFARTITRPIRALQEGVMALARGELNVRLPEDAHNELGQVAREFNTMAKEIFEAEALLAKQKQDLEAQVMERRQSEVRFKGLLESAPDAMVIVDHVGHIVLANKRAQDLFGYDVEQIVGQPVEMLMPEASHQRHRQHRNDYFVDPQTRPMGVGIELFGRRKDGREFPVEISLSPLETESGILVSSTIRDITVRHETDKRLRDERNLLRTVIDNIPDYIFVKDRDGKMTLANNAVLRDIGGKTLEDVIGKSDFDILPKEEAERYFAQEQALLETGQSIINLEAPITVQNERHWVLSNKVPLRDSDGNIVGLVGINRDITERQEAEEKIRKLNSQLAKQVKERTQQLAQLKALNQELEAFSYSVSHDLRAPLRAMDGFSQALLEDYYDNVDDNGKEYLVLIRYESQRMAQLIDGLLNLSRFTRVELAWQEVDLSALVRKIAEELQRMEPHRKVEFDIEDVPAVCGDVRLLEVVFQNLIGNAWKYSSKKKDARIEFGTLQEDGKTFYFVRDNGAGFDMAYLNKLFGAFQRLHSSAEFEGTGVGLATVQRIVHRHGGIVRAKGESGVGATFYFTLGAGNCE